MTPREWGLFLFGTFGWTFTLVLFGICRKQDKLLQSASGLLLQCDDKMTRQWALIKGLLDGQKFDEVINREVN